MNVYFDTEFTGLVPGTTLISLGIVSENGYKFYAEFTDYDESLCDDWIKENVIENLWLFPNEKDFPKFDFDDEGHTWYCKGDTKFIKARLLVWLEQVSEACYEINGDGVVVICGNLVQFVSDVCHYDFYLLQNQVFGGAFNMPDNINPVCYDICQDINELERSDVSNSFNTSKNMRVAFDISREGLLEEHHIYAPSGRKHNALYDAEVIKLLYEYYYNEKYARLKRDAIETFNRYVVGRIIFDSWFEDPEYIKACGMRLPMARKE